MKTAIEYKLEEIQLILLNKKINKIGLLGGDLGCLLFHYHYYVYSKNENSFATIQVQLDRILKKFVKCNFTFCSGIAGFGWLLNYFFKEKFLDSKPDEIFTYMDSIIGKWMISEIEKGNYDFMHGSGGVAVYFLSKLSDLQSKLFLERFVKCLYNACVKAEDGSIKWESIVNFENNQKGYGISLSHGISSIMNVLCKLYKKNIYKDTCCELIYGALKYIMKQKLPIGKFNSIYPSWSLESSTKLYGSRLSWCYGDLGIAVTFWNVAQILNDKMLEKESIDILMFSSKRRDLMINSVFDAGICHGTAGISHIFKRMYFNTKIPEFNEAANYWLGKTLEFSKYVDGFAGFKSFCPVNRGGLKPMINLLEGISGIGLALLSNISENEPTWDECLLLS